MTAPADMDVDALQLLVSSLTAEVSIHLLRDYLRTCLPTSSCGLLKVDRLKRELGDLHGTDTVALRQALPGLHAFNLC